MWASLVGFLVVLLVLMANTACLYILGCSGTANLWSAEEKNPVVQIVVTGFAVLAGLTAPGLFLNVGVRDHKGDRSDQASIRNYGSTFYCAVVITAAWLNAYEFLLLAVAFNVGLIIVVPTADRGGAPFLYSSSFIRTFVILTAINIVFLCDLILGHDV